jgi:single-strand DNA-binding protein
MVNKVILIGSLGSDPKMNYTQGGTAIANLSVATSRKVKDASGQYVDETEWHRVTVFDKQAEFCGNYLKKGSKIYTEGRLQTRKWKDQTGADRYTTEVIANTVQNLSPRNDSGKSERNTDQYQGTGDEVPF